MHIQTKLNKQRAKANQIAATHAQARRALAQKLDAIAQPILAEYNARMDAHLATLQKRKINLSATFTQRWQCARIILGSAWRAHPAILLDLTKPM